MFFDILVDIFVAPTVAPLYNWLLSYYYAVVSYPGKSQVIRLLGCHILYIYI